MKFSRDHFSWVNRDYQRMNCSDCCSTRRKPNRIRFFNSGNGQWLRGVTRPAILQFSGPSFWYVLRTCEEQQIISQKNIYDHFQNSWHRTKRGWDVKCLIVRKGTVNLIFEKTKFLNPDS